MVGGLVMGALEKLYRQPSLFAYPLLTRVQSLPLLFKKAKKKRSPTRYREYSPTALQYTALRVTHRHTPSFQGAQPATSVNWIIAVYLA
jgi:hypothetical protein